MYIYVIYIFFFRFFSLVGYYKRLSSLCSTVGQFYLHGMGVWEAPTKPPPHRILSHPGTFLFDLHAQVIFPSQVRGDLPVRPAPAACSTWVAFLEDWLGFCTPPIPFSTSCSGRPILTMFLICLPASPICALLCPFICVSLFVCDRLYNY